MPTKKTLSRRPMLCCAAAIIFSSPALAQDCSFKAKPGGSAQTQALAQDVGRTNPCTTVPGLKAKSLSSVWAAMLASGKTGGKRFDTPPPAGLPSGRVMADSQGVEFKLQALADEGVLGLQVRQGATLVFSVSSPTQSSVWLPTSRMKPGASYDWMLSTRAGAYRARFELLEADEAAGVQAQLDALAAAALQPATRLLYTAAIFDQAELYAARDQVLQEIRNQVAP